MKGAWGPRKVNVSRETDLDITGEARGLGRQREDRAVWWWVGKDREWVKSKDAGAGMSLGGGEEACQKAMHGELWGGLLKVGGPRSAQGMPWNQVKGLRRHANTTGARLIDQIVSDLEVRASIAHLFGCFSYKDISLLHELFIHLYREENVFKSHYGWLHVWRNEQLACLCVCAFVYVV